jgi:hypothetical protein
MLDFKTQSQIVDATASMMRWYVTAAINTSAVSASRSLSLWSELLEAAKPRPAPSKRAQASAPIGINISPSHADAMETPLGQVAQWPWFNGSIPSTSPLARAWWIGSNAAMWNPLAGWTAWSRASLPAWNGWFAPVPSSSPRAASNGAAKRADDSGYASYRSAGGHASTQVIMGTAPSRTNGRALPPKSS